MAAKMVTSTDEMDAAAQAGSELREIKLWSDGPVALRPAVWTGRSLSYVRSAFHRGTEQQFLEEKRQQLISMRARTQVLMSNPALLPAPSVQQPVLTGLSPVPEISQLNHKIAQNDIE